MALQPLHVTFQDGGARKFKSEKSPSETSICGLTRPKIQIHVSDISCVQRAFWAQPVETVEVPFKASLLARIVLAIVILIYAIYSLTNKTAYGEHLAAFSSES